MGTSISCQRNRILIIFTLFIISFLVVSPANATLSVSNIKLLTDAAPGDVITYPVTVSSDAGDSPIDVYVDVMGFGQSLDMAYTPLSPAQDISPYSARPFIHLNKASVRLSPGTSEDITATITIPKDAGGGGRYAMLYVHTGSDASTNVQSYSIAYAIPVMITITGHPEQEKGTIAEISAVTFQQGGPVYIQTMLQNTGNHHYYNTVNTVRVLDQSGKAVTDVTLPPTLFAIIPTANVQYSAGLKKNLTPGSYTIVSTVTLEGGAVLDEKRSPVTIGESGLLLSQAETTPATLSNASSSSRGMEPGTMTANEQGSSISLPPSGSQDQGVNIAFSGESQPNTGGSVSDFGVNIGESMQFPEQTWERNSITLTPKTTGQLESSNKQISISIPEGSVIGNVDLTVQPVSRTQLSGPPSNFRLAGTLFRVEGLAGLLAKDATITITYSQADRDAAAGDPSRLVLARWDESDGKWTLMPTTVDLNAGTLTVTTNHLSTWAVMAQSGPVPVRTTYVPGPDPGMVCGMLAVFIVITGTRSKK
ncbi:MAG: hypothetical protein NTY71_04485 [Methanoregula sp.]|nr:hypothetical protein [Methanoregula sp.]